MKLLIATWLLVSAVLLALSAAASPAFAEIEGNCEATFKGVSVDGLDSSNEDQAIPVEGDEVVEIVFTSPTGFESYDIELQFLDGVDAGGNIASDNDVGGDEMFSDTVNVKDYAWAGGGYYRVSGTARLTDGSNCEGAALIDVDKAFFTTAAGIIALGVTGGGVAGIAGANYFAAKETGRAYMKVEEWVVSEMDKAPEPSAQPSATSPDSGSEGHPLEDVDFQDIADFADIIGLRGCVPFVLPAIVITGLMMAGLLPTSALAGASARGRGRRLKRVGWRPRLSAAGILGGLLFGVGLIVLLQQAGVIFPDVTQLVGAIVLGLVLGLVLPSLIRVVTVIRVNGAIARAEKRLAARSGATGAGTGSRAAPSAPPTQAGDAGQEPMRSDQGTADEQASSPPASERPPEDDTHE